MISEVLSNQELRRYKNQIALSGIGINGQKKIKQTSVVVIGTGGIGTSVMQHLVAAGIGTLGIIDNALVDESNIHRQTIYGTTDLGKQKTIITKQKLHELNTNAKLNIHNLYVSYENINNICRNYDIVVDASNSAETNITIWSYCQQYKKPLIFGRVSEFEIEIGFFTDTEKLRELIEKNQNPNTKVKTGFLSPVAGIVGSLISIEIIFYIAGIKNQLLNNIKMINVLSHLSK